MHNFWWFRVARGVHTDCSVHSHSWPPARAGEPLKTAASGGHYKPEGNPCPPRSTAVDCPPTAPCVPVSAPVDCIFVTRERFFVTCQAPLFRNTRAAFSCVTCHRDHFFVTRERFFVHATWPLFRNTRALLQTSMTDSRYESTETRAGYHPKCVYPKNRYKVR